MTESNDSSGAKPSGSDADSTFSDVNRLLQLLNRLDERGLILSLAAFSEVCLGEIILKYLHPIKESRQLVDGFNAPLGTFSSRIKAALALGLITRRQYEDLDRLRRARNEMAHTWEPISLDDSRVSLHIDAMSFDYHLQIPPPNRRSKLSTTFAFLLIELSSTRRQIEADRLGARSIGRHLIAGFSGDLESQLLQARSEIVELNDRILMQEIGDVAFFRDRKQHLANRIFYIIAASAEHERDAASYRCVELFELLGAYPDFIDELQEHRRRLAQKTPAPESGAI